MVSNHCHHDHEAPKPPTRPKFKKVKVLGSGSFGRVYLVVLTDDLIHERPLPSLFAMKTAPIERSSTLEKERVIFKDLNGCPEILRCFGKTFTFDSSFDYYNLILEYAPAGTLKDLIVGINGSMPETNIKTYTRMLLRGLRYMHAKGYVHCDIKPDNILAIPSTQVNDVVYQLKIADFGSAKQPKEVISSKKYKLQFRGTPLYMSPESVKFGKIDTALDIWSLGCVVIYMATGKPPWHGTSAYRDKRALLYALAIDDKSLKIPDNCCLSESGKDFLSKCLAIDPKQRWSAEMLLEHPYISEGVRQQAAFLLPQQLFRRPQILSQVISSPQTLARPDKLAATIFKAMKSSHR